MIFLPVYPSAAGDFVAGADFSLLAFFESRGIVYRDAGQAQDGLAILKRHGLNCVRLRLFTSSTAQAQADPLQLHQQPRLYSPAGTARQERRPAIHAGLSLF